MPVRGANRRAFIAGLGGAAAWPVVARAQQAMPVVGYLSGNLREADATRVRAFLQGLSESGYVEGRNVVIEYCWAEGQYDHLPDLAADLVRRKVDVITAMGGSPIALAAKSVTATIPIIFGVSVNPVEAGFVGSLNHPDGNLTGVTILSAELFEKRVELLRELMPKAKVIAVLANPNNRLENAETAAAEKGARALGLELRVLNASSVNDIEPVFARLAESAVDALIVSTDIFLGTRKPLIVALAAKQRLPAIYPWREWIELGGLVSYGADALDAHRMQGVYAAKVLKGANPADLPVEQSIKFELVLNLKTATALGLIFPASILARADEVIE